MDKLIPIKVPINSQDYWINKLGSLRYTIMLGPIQQSRVVEPIDIGESLHEAIHILVGYTIINKEKYVLYKYKDLK